MPRKKTQPAKRKRGRPKGGAKIGAPEKTAFLKNVRELGFKHISAERLGFTAAAFDYHLQRDEAFRAKFYEARAYYERRLLKQVDSPVWILQHLRPEHYTQRQHIEHAGEPALKIVEVQPGVLRKRPRGSAAPGDGE